MIHVALCLTDTPGTYYKHALVTALSILDNTTSRICLHLVHDETFSQEAIRSFEAVFQQYGQEFRLYHANTIPQETINNIPASLGKGTLYKTMLPKLVSVDKILYLDCDIVCLVDVSKIFCFDISDHYLGAVKMEPWQGKKWIRNLKLTCGFCINAGVLLMNLDKIRKDIPDYEERLFSIGRNSPVKVGDQGATNLLFDKIPGAYFFLPGFCNLRTEQSDHSTWPLKNYYGNVVHFAGKKPWQVLTQPGLLYWKYYARLFPGEDVFERMEKLAPYEYACLLSFILRDDARRRKVQRGYEIEKNGFWGTLRKRLKR